MWKRVSILWAVVKGDARQLWFALRHPDSPVWLKAGSALLALYLLSPIDLIPETIPLLGIVDDIVLIPAVIRWMLNRLPNHVRAHAQQRAAGRPGSGPFA